MIITRFKTGEKTMVTISNIISYLLNLNMEFSIHNSKVIDKGNYAYIDIIISILDPKLKIICKFFNKFENIEYYIKNADDCYRFYDLDEFHAYMLKTKA